MLRINNAVKQKYGQNWGKPSKEEAKASNKALKEEFPDEREHNHKKTKKIKEYEIGDSVILNVFNTKSDLNYVKPIEFIKRINLRSSSLFSDNFDGKAVRRFQTNEIKEAINSFNKEYEEALKAGGELDVKFGYYHSDFALIQNDIKVLITKKELNKRSKRYYYTGIVCNSFDRLSDFTRTKLDIDLLNKEFKNFIMGKEVTFRM